MPPRRYRIEVVGRLPDGAEHELPGMAISAGRDTTTLIGVITDAAALYGIVARLESLGVALLAVQPDPPPDGSDCR